MDTVIDVMTHSFVSFLAAASLSLTASLNVTLAQETPKERPDAQRREEGGPGGGERDRFGGEGFGRGRMRVSPLMQALDTNHDGELSAEEIANAPKALKSLDKNGDGKLSAEELRPVGGFGPGGPGGEGRRSNAAEVADQVGRLMAFDKNGDGKLAPDELPERMRSIVTRADTNHDGFATKEELTALITAQAARNPSGGPEGGERRGPRREQE